MLRGVSPRNNATSLKQFPRKHILLIAGIVAVVIGLTLMLSLGQLQSDSSEMSLAIDVHQLSIGDSVLNASSDIQNIKKQEDDRSAIVTISNDITSKLGKWHTVKIKSGDNLSVIFTKQGLGSDVVRAIVSTPKLGKVVTKIRPRETLEFRINNRGELTQLRYVQSKLKSIFFSKTNSGYRAELIRLEPQIRIAYSHGEIERSLFITSQRVGLSDRLTMKLAGIFGWDIDFIQDIRRGDGFHLIYEEKYLNDKKLGDGNILAATFRNQGKTYTAVRYTDSKGDTSYYSPSGQSMKKAFLRAPVDFARISSRFNPNRLHPVFKTKRPHRGVDYAAPTNTPIRAAGDGRVKFAGWQRGYGNVVYIQHPSNIVTVYAHQNKIRRGLKKGRLVKQGQTIGYVGQTGWATGPHLHYEFRLNGRHRNPVTVKLPDASPIKKEEMARFKAHSQKMLVYLENTSKALLAKQ
ncbi:MAG: M23 family metallopeptidase [Candidatus Endonucleobacter bathymodioli]|uniref:M23 family metallopeptidase n=1 Tax=Candidatus Endonucleibacter bathymodioli TaxID=539814 RepID=A0AA90NVZ6_9GAMM|nr:M23 family metallopeptidase [Candidatus Endonucleobacter bathymodioli]